MIKIQRLTENELKEFIYFEKGTREEIDCIIGHILWQEEQIKNLEILLNKLTVIHNLAAHINREFVRETDLLRKRVEGLRDAMNDAIEDDWPSIYRALDADDELAKGDL